MIRRVREHSADDAGFALVFVVGTMLVLAMLALTALAYTMSSTKFARFDQDYSGAMSAAQSGVQDFLSHLNRDDEYYESVDCGNVALRGPSVPGNTCGWGAGTPLGWAPVKPGSTGPKDAFFHYSFDGSGAISDGYITVVVTGKVNGRYRTVETALTKGGSTDYVYYTDFESADPSNVQAYTATKKASLDAGEKVRCGFSGYLAAKHWWSGREGAGCVEIQFGSTDTLWGSVFTNDSVYASGPTFKEQYTSANPECATVTASSSTWNRCLRKDGGTYSTANFNGHAPRLAENGALLRLDDNSAAFATNPGCHYYGSTRIIFGPTAGKMTVWNSTLNNGGMAPTPIAPPGGTDPDCGDLTELNQPGGIQLDVPNKMVIYAAGEPTGITRSQCSAGQIGGNSASPSLPLGTYTKAIASAKPATTTSKYTYDTTMSESTKYCQEGNLYIEGTVGGRVTVAAEQSVVLTGDLVLAGGLSGSDMVGIVATNSVEVFHPWMKEVSAMGSPCPSSSSCKWNTASPTTPGAVAGWPRHYPDPTGAVVVSGIDIMASIQTLQHSFYVQQYDVGGPQGTLQVDGSIAQRWRGIVGVGGGSPTQGYSKNYVYDLRLKHSAPPYFPRWLDAQWGQRYFGELATPPALKN